jgi:hypothetical protein
MGETDWCDCGKPVEQCPTKGDCVIDTYIMKVTTVTAAVKYSLDTGHGWKAIELGAEATLTASAESWEKAQAELYRRLGQQLKVLWSSGNGKAQASPEPGRREGYQEAPVVNAQPAQVAPPPSAPPKDHWCSEHNQEFKKRNGQYGEFWSHQIKGTKEWCNEAKK